MCNQELRHVTLNKTDSKGVNQSINVKLVLSQNKNDILLTFFKRKRKKNHKVFYATHVAQTNKDIYKIFMIIDHNCL